MKYAYFCVGEVYHYELNRFSGKFYFVLICFLNSYFHLPITTKQDAWAGEVTTYYPWKNNQFSEFSLMNFGE